MGDSSLWTEKYPVNIGKANEIVDGDLEILEELFTIFTEHLPEQQASLEKAIKEKDGKNARFFAHQIKGAMRNFAAEAACEKAFQIEQAGKEDDFSYIDDLYRGLIEELKVLNLYIEKKWWKSYF